MTQKTLPKNSAEEGLVCWTSPSNIAITKYWGKYGNQLPRNPSISMTLQNAYTKTAIKYKRKKTKDLKLSLKFFFDNEPNEAFQNKIEKLLIGWKDFFSFIFSYHIEIYSTNTFPHSSGIASSASAMSALVLCLLDIKKIVFSTEDFDFIQTASNYARLASGSASRSVYPGWSTWGKNSYIKDASNLYAVEINKAVHENFKDFHDDIYIVSDKEKSVSSTAGHALMENNVYASARFRQAIDNTNKLYDILKVGDIKAFGELAEAEAMSLHAMMMCSTPSYVLMEPNSLAIIQAIRQHRKDYNVPIYFTLDAGPNIHILYPERAFAYAQSLISELIDKYGGYVIQDKIGGGPEKLT